VQMKYRQASVPTSPQSGASTSPDSTPSRDAPSSTSTIATPPSEDGVTTFTVPGATYQTLNAAVAGVPEGAVITLIPGSEHIGPVTITKSLTIQGKATITIPTNDDQNTTAVIIDGPGTLARLRDITVTTDPGLLTDASLLASTEFRLEYLVKVLAGRLEAERCVFGGSRGFGVFVDPQASEEKPHLADGFPSALLIDCQIRNIASIPLASTGFLGEPSPAEVPGKNLTLEGCEMSACGEDISLAGRQIVQFLNSRLTTCRLRDSRLIVKDSSFSAEDTRPALVVIGADASCEAYNTTLDADALGVSIRADVLAKFHLSTSSKKSGRLSKMIVMPNPKYDSLRSALEAVPAGGTLLLERNKFYDGPVTVTKPVHILGQMSRISREKLLFEERKQGLGQGPLVTINVPDAGHVICQDLIVEEDTPEGGFGIAWDVPPMEMQMGQHTLRNGIRRVENQHGFQVTQGSLNLRNCLVRYILDCGIVLAPKAESSGSEPAICSLTNVWIERCKGTGIRVESTLPDSKRHQSDNLKRPVLLRANEVSITTTETGVVLRGWGIAEFTEVKIEETERWALSAGPGILAKFRNVQAPATKGSPTIAAGGHATRVELIGPGITPADIKIASGGADIVTLPAP